MLVSFVCRTIHPPRWAPRPPCRPKTHPSLSLSLPINRTHRSFPRRAPSFKVLREIFQTGFSRIPVQGRAAEDVIGLSVKDPIFVDPEDETPCSASRRSRAAVGAGGGRSATCCNSRAAATLPVRGINEFDDGRDSTYGVRGIITLEDIVEAILGDEIVDETDQYVHMERKDRVNRADFDYGKLDLLDDKLNENLLSPEEINAIAAHLCTNFGIFKQAPSTGAAISVEDVKALLANTVKHALTLTRAAAETDPQPAKSDYVYTRQRPATKLTVVLSGKLSVAAGKDAFRSEAGPWTVLGADALSEEEGSYLPDFSAFIATPQVRCLQISRVAYAKATSRAGGPQGPVAAGRRGAASSGSAPVHHHERPPRNDSGIDDDAATIQRGRWGCAWRGRRGSAGPPRRPSRPRVLICGDRAPKHQP